MKVIVSLLFYNLECILLTKAKQMMEIDRNFFALLHKTYFFETIFKFQVLHQEKLNKRWFILK